MNQFFNTKETLVTEAIDGLLRSNDALARLDGYPHIKVVVRTDWDKSKVALVSGGGTGHEPKNDERKAFIDRCCGILTSHEKVLNALDARSGDGDTGSTLATAARAMKLSLDELPLADMTQLYRAIGMQLSQTMGGSSGVLLAIFFAAAGDASATGQDTAGSLSAGLERIQQVGGASPGDRTMIDALKPALEALPGGLDAARVAARDGANYTASSVRAKAGRASYISTDKLKGHNDPGAEAIALLLEGLEK